MTLSDFDALRARPVVRWLGIMSGTSCDGVDVAVIEVTETEEGPRVEVLGGEVHSYPAALRRELLDDLRDPPDVARAARWDRRLAELFVEAAKPLAGDVDAVAVAGHTFSHQPEHGATLQLGSPAVVAAGLGRAVVSSFRTSDVARGGEGAPLVPAADRILFAEDDRGIAVVNLGGIGNLTWLPGREEPRAEDTGPSNLILDELMRLATNGQESVDIDGARASRGKVLPWLLSRWEEHAFFEDGGVRSTGRELFGEKWAEQVWRHHGRENLSDLLATGCALVARGVLRSLERMSAGHSVDRVLIGGGGAKNPVVLQELDRGLPVRPEILDGEKHGVSSDLREAVAFAILGHEFLHGRPGSFPTTTGCREAGPNGALWLPTYSR